ncbi:mechanosensitive ion channel domain-containing protein [Sphingomonas sp. LY54]|uniref:mechanosensitive ion channel family protein n=1 Tax=Sphingomonas sp. LY54 TaxID=3095343 RepID=UPI002D76AF75|nr:mechanosensitive ion channel domain-containing protein [Sphingomonas sp. LY54]WRP28417.1 mechanosensitive ion channel domain-containing protein [Sphingomonas sp. LY54]
MHGLEVPRSLEDFMAVNQPASEAAANAVGDFFGLPPVASADFGDMAIAFGLVAAIFLLVRWMSRRLRRWLDAKVAPKLEGAQHQRVLASNHAASAIGAIAGIILLTMAAAAHDWLPYSMLLFDLAIPLASALAAWRVALAFNVPESGALAIAFICGFAVLTRRYEQLDFVERSLDGYAVTFGETEISLLDVLGVAFAGVVLYAVVRVANQGAKAFIRRRSNLDITQSLLAEKIAAIVIAVMAIFVAIDMLGIDTTALSVFSGTVGLGLGFGLQKIFSNLVSGIILLMDRSIKPGDVIVVGEAVGEVNRIGTRAVSVITRDGKEYLIPNELLMTERVENWNYSSRNVRIRMTIRVGYESDVDLVERLLQRATQESPRVLDAPPPAVRITDISNSGIKIELRFWISDPEDGLGNIQSEIYKRVLAKFREHDIVLPNEGRDVEITKVPPIYLKGAEES